MIDHISLKTLDTLVLKEETPERAASVLQELEKTTKQAQQREWSTNYVISLKNSKITITGEIRYALTNFCQSKILSEKRGVELVQEISALREREKKSQKIAAAQNIYAKRQLNRSYPTAASLNPSTSYEMGSKLKGIMKELEELRAETPFLLRSK